MLVAGLGGVALGLVRSWEPAYKGKRLSVWLHDYESLIDDGPLNVTASVGGEANEAVRHMGTNAIPTLLRLLYSTDSDLRRGLNNLAARQHFNNIHFSTQYERNQKALYGFAALGLEASNAVPTLVQGLRSDDEETRENSALALSLIHAKPELAVAALIQCLEDPQGPVRSAALDALFAYKPPADLMVPVLIRCLQEADNPIELRAVALLRDYGPAAKPALPVLIHLFETEYDKYWQSSWVIGAALEAVDPEAAAKAGLNWK